MQRIDPVRGQPPGTAGKYMVGRQPIFDRKLAVFGYELLFRGGPTSGPDAPSGDDMTAEVLVRTGLDSGVANVVGDRPAFVNVPRSYLVGELEIPLPPDQVVLELPETAVHDDDLLAGCRRLVEAGYVLALDDYEWCPGDEAFLELASIVKLDVLALGPSRIAEHLERCRRPGGLVVAEKVETHEQLDVCRSLGFDLFQGYVLSRPQIVTGRVLAPNRITLLRLVGKICHPDTSTRELEDVVESDVGLSQRLLRVAGAGARNGVRREVRSIREGVVMLGRARLRSWLLLMLATDTGDAAPEQVSIAMTRAKMCEVLMEAVDPSLSDSAFTVGLVSCLDVLLGAPLSEIVGELNLSTALADALLHRMGLLGGVLSDVLAWELGQTWLRSAVDPVTIERGYLEALRWTTDLNRSLHAA